VRGLQCQGAFHFSQCIGVRRVVNVVSVTAVKRRPAEMQMLSRITGVGPVCLLRIPISGPSVAREADPARFLCARRRATGCRATTAAAGARAARRATRGRSRPTRSGPATTAGRCVRPTVRALSGRLSGLSVSHSKSVLYGVWVWARRVLNSQKRRFPARAGGADGPEADRRWCG
jgi:hypothetical protein